MKNARVKIEFFNKTLTDLAFGVEVDKEVLLEMKGLEDSLTKEGYMQKPFWVERNGKYKKVSQFLKRRATVFASEFMKVSVRPENHAGNYPTGDCSTRAIAYVLGRDYKEVFAAQHAKGHRWKNVMGGIRDVMKPMGYDCLILHQPLTLHKVAYELSVSCEKYIAVSANHAVAVDNGRVIDTWDSRATRVKMLIVSSDDSYAVCRILGATHYERW